MLHKQALGQHMEEAHSMRTQERLYIGGEWVTPAGTGVLEVVSPHTEEVVGRVPEGTPADIDRAVAAAREAFDHGPWPRLSPAERAEVVFRLADLYGARLEEMASLITEEMGCAISFSQIMQAGVPHQMLSIFAELGRTFAW